MDFFVYLINEKEADVDYLIKIFSYLNDKVRIKNKVKIKEVKKINLPLAKEKDGSVNVERLVQTLAGYSIRNEHHKVIVLINEELSDKEVRNRYSAHTGFEAGKKDYDYIIMGKKALNNLEPLIIHELGHLLGACQRKTNVEKKRGEHCTNKDCVMNTHDNEKKTKEFFKEIKERFKKGEIVFCNECLEEIT